jgi:hypothetical protein
MASAKAKRVTLSDLVGGIDVDREHGNLSSAEGQTLKPTTLGWTRYFIAKDVQSGDNL